MEADAAGDIGRRTCPFTSAFGRDHQRLLLLAPAHGGARDQFEDVGLLGQQPGDGELPGVGAHLHRGPPQRVPAVQAVGDLVAWRGADGRTDGGEGEVENV